MNSTEALFKRTLFSLVCGSTEKTVNITEWSKLIQAHANFPVVLPLGKLMASVNTTLRKQDKNVTFKL